MIMRSPIVAMLWENWRLTRVEAAQRLGLGLVAGSAALALFKAGAIGAFWILLMLHGIFWLSIAKLNGGRFMDGYKPGFPLYLLYSRPVSTVVFVGVVMAYDAIACTAMYLLSAAVLGIAFGQPLPLLSVALWIVTFHVLCIAIQWSTQNRVVQWVGSFVICAPLFFLLKERVASPLRVEFSLAENTLMALACLVAFGLTVAGVARQRHGGAVAPMLRTKSAGYPDWLVGLFRFPCPTSSATRAQLWFELRSSGLPVLAIGLSSALLIFLLFAISIPVPVVRPFALASAMFFAPALLLYVGGNAFGIRQKQGRTYVSAFEATQPNGTAQLAGLKVLVRTACVLVALIAVGVSVWGSSSLISAWGEWLLDGKTDSSQGLLKFRREIGDSFFGGLTGYALAARAIVASIAVAITVASFAVLAALRARYPRHLLVAGSLLLLYGLVLVLLVMASENGIGPEFLLHATLKATFWIAAATPVVATAYLFWSGFAERALTIRYAVGALVISVAFAVASLPGNTVSMLSTVLLSLMVCVLAPWSLNRIRHV
jgi:hypothetical protein